MNKPRYDPTVASIAGDVMAGLIDSNDRIVIGDVEIVAHLAKCAVLLARAIVAETKRTEPVVEDDKS